MQVSVESTSTLERKLTIGVDAANIEKEIEKRLAQVSRTAKVDGFRAGKVPMRVIKQRYAQGVRQEVLGEQIQRSFIQAVTQEKLNPAGTPRIEQVNDKEGEDFTFVATFEVYPEVKVGGLENISIEKPVAEVTDADVDNMISILSKQQAKWVDSSAAAKDGDRVKLDFEGFIDGTAFEGGKADGYVLAIGSKSMIPGFEDQVVGMAVGQEGTVKVTFPADYHKEDLKGKAAEFKVKVHEIKTAELPELNPEFFAKYGVDCADEAAFKVEVKKNMVRELKQAVKRQVKNVTLEALLAQNALEVPASLVDQEVARMQQQAVSQFGGGQKLDPSQLPRELFADQAVHRVKLGLLINATIEQFAIKAGEEKINEIIADLASTFQDADQVVEYYKSNREQRAQIEALALEEAVVDAVLAKAKVTEKSASYEEVIRAANNG